MGVCAPGAGGSPGRELHHAQIVLRGADDALDVGLGVAVLLTRDAVHVQTQVRRKVLVVRCERTAGQCKANVCGCRTLVLACSEQVAVPQRWCSINRGWLITV